MGLGMECMQRLWFWFGLIGLGCGHEALGFCFRKVEEERETTGIRPDLRGATESGSRMLLTVTISTIRFYRSSHNEFTLAQGEDFRFLTWLWNCRQSTMKTTLEDAHNHSELQPIAGTPQGRTL